MFYKLTDTTGGAENLLTSRLTSFWMSCDFNAPAAAGVVAVTRGAFAFYCDWPTGGVAAGVPQAAGAQGTPRQYRIEAPGMGSFEVKNATLREVINLRRSNEVGKLFVFEFVLDANGKSTWLNADAWQPGHVAPGANSDGSPFLPDRASFGDQFENRYVYQMLTRLDNSGLRTLGLVMPFLSQSAIEHLLYKSNQAQTMSSITVCGANGAPQTYLDQVPLTGNVDAYAMVAQGGFKGLAADAALGDWYLRAPMAQSPSQLATRLAGVLAQGSAFRRTLGNIHDTAANGVTPEPAHSPVEVLYLDNLNVAAAAPLENII